MSDLCHRIILIIRKLNCAQLSVAGFIFFHCKCTLCLQHFESDTEDLAGLEWSPDGRVLGVWESCLQVHILGYIQALG